MKTIRKIALTLIAALIATIFVGIPALAEYNMPYFIDVDITNQITTIYSTKDGSIVRQMICSSGINGSTPLGVWYMCEKGRASERTAWTWLQEYKVYVRFATRVHLGYMFHSLPYNSKSDAEPDQKATRELGTPASHGCIRLRWEDAYFIAMNCLTGTRVNFFESGEVDEDLRQLLLVSSYTNEDGMTYNEFLGYSEDALGRGSGGTEVADLQHRLNDLGYYEGQMLGQYDTETAKSVKKVQGDLGLPQSGVADQDLLNMLYSNDAPVSSGNTTLKLGNSGPVVEKLQEALTQAGLYSGTIDGIYTPAVEESVKQFQGVCNLAADGVATPQLQQILYYEVEEILENCGTGYTSTAVTEDIIFATVVSEMKIILREQNNTESHEVGKVSNGDTVIVDGADDEWAHIIVGSKQGYIRKKYLQASPQKNYVMQYSGPNGDFSIGHTMQEYLSGAQSVAQQFANGVPAKKSTVLLKYITVNTGSDSVGLNLRETASADGQIIGQVPNGTKLNVIGNAEGWTQVSYGDQMGFLMNDYLEFWEGGPDALYSEVEDEDTNAQDVSAIVVSASGSAEVFNEATQDSTMIGTIGSGTTVKVLDMGDSEFVKIELNGVCGFIPEKNLQFQLN